MRADLAALIEKQDLAALKYTKQGRPFADRLIAADPKAYDAYLGPGVENYLLSLKPAPLRALLWITGSQVDRAKGIEELRMTAQFGHYLEPFAKLLLAVAALRDNNRTLARDLLSGLHNRFPDNPLYLRELNRLSSAVEMTTATQFPVEIDHIRKHYDRLSFLYRLFWGEHLHHGYWESNESVPRPRSS